MKKVKYILIILFTVFSFYYTNQIVNLSKNNDPLLRELKKIEKESLQLPVNAVISENIITVGKRGRKLDVNTSYDKMKSSEEYNAALLEYIDLKPSILKKDNYERSINGVVSLEKEVSIVFLIENIDDLKKIINILENYNMDITFYMDGKLIERNILYIKSINSKYKIGIYSYNNLFNSASILYMKRLLVNFNTSDYCLYYDDKFLNECSKLRINTIKPVIVSNNIYSFFKDKKESGMIYQIIVSNNNIKNLDASLMYLNQKGYLVKSLDELLKE